MKQLLIIPVVFLAACASRPAKKITIIHTEPSRSNVAPLRLAENVREYRFGRYTDPRDPRVMHESHPVYRIETDANWNLNQSASGVPLPKQSSVQRSIASNDAVLAEVNKQRAVTKAFIEQTTTLNQKLGELSQVAGQSQEIAKQNLALKRDMTALQQRLDAVESQARERKVTSPAEPKPNAEDKW
jgi:hypothetical protein